STGGRTAPRARADDCGRRVTNPTQHHRRASTRVPAGAAVMDLELSEDQVALRDGIAAMLAARVPMERVRAGFDRAMFDDLAAAGVFSLRRDGFSWSDCVVVFEQLGRACVPGPLVASLLHGRGERAGVLLGGWVEHLAELDVVVVPEEGVVRAADVVG